MNGSRDRLRREPAKRLLALRQLQWNRLAQLGIELDPDSWMTACSRSLKLEKEMLV